MKTQIWLFYFFNGKDGFILHRGDHEYKVADLFIRAANHSFLY